jgi:hypothetical protein
MLHGRLLVPLPDELPVLRTRLKRHNYACRLPSGALAQASGERRLEHHCIRCAPLLRHRRCLFLSAAKAAHRRYAVRAWLLELHRLRVFARGLAECAGAMKAFALQFPWQPGQPIDRYRHSLPERVMVELYEDKEGRWSLTLEGARDWLREEMEALCREQFRVPEAAGICKVMTERRRMVRWTWNEGKPSAL